MTALAYAVACLALVGAAAGLRVIPCARRETGRLWAAVAGLGAPGLSDAERERRARQAALAALAGTAGLFLRLGAVACATLAPLWLADAAGLAPLAAVAAFALRLDVLAATSGVAALGVALARRRRHGRA